MLILSKHAIRRLGERGILLADLTHVIDTGEVIEEYPDDEPFPSRLIFGWCKMRPLNVIAADHPDEPGNTFIISAYQPDLLEWEPGFRKRRQP